jgi:hypothetical protein
MGTNKNDWLYSEGDPYFGPAQVKMFIRGVWVDDVCAVTYHVQDQKTPKFGYNDRRVRSWALGPTLVQGRLAINYRYNGYLARVIANNLKERYETDSDVQKRLKALANLPFTQAMTDSDSVLDLGVMAAESLDPRNREMIFGLLKQGWDQPSFFNKFDTIKKALALQQLQKGAMEVYNEHERAQAVAVRTWEELAEQRPGLFTKGLDLAIMYGAEPADKIASDNIKVIQDLQITGESQAISIDVPDGSRAIREIYPFLAADIRPGPPRSGFAYSAIA